MKAGQKYLFTPTGSEFELAKVTEKRVSWYVGFNYKSGTGKNTLKMATVSVRQFLRGIESGAYKLIEVS